MKQQTNFLVTITHTEHYSWQGYIQWLDTGQKVHFRSEREMLALMDEAILSQSSIEKRTFKDSPKMSLVRKSGS